jgi:uncharacterized protein
MGGPAVIGGGGIGVIILAIAIYACGGDPTQLLDNLQSGTSQEQQQRQPDTAASGSMSPEEQGKFARAMMGSLEDYWRTTLPQQTRTRYRDPKLVLFTGRVSSACGRATSATGPFYCPADDQLYLDFAFFNELAREFNAPGDFAQAYVIAHEFGHHIQNLQGTMDKVQRAGNNNKLSVAVELQADCYAGMWASSTQKQGRLEPGDIEEAIRAAGAVGDDMIQKRTQGYVVPDSFTHGTAQQRMEYFSRGFRSGDIRQCQTLR